MRKTFLNCLKLYTPPPGFENLNFTIFLFISTQIIYIDQIIHSSILYTKLSAISNLFSFFIHPIDNGLVNAVVFIDLKKAFDTIDHQIILKKLENYGIDHSSLKWFKLYLTGRTQKYQVNDRLSNSTSVKCDIPQGSTFRPLPFLIYINDLPDCLHHATPRMFADDTSLNYATDSPSELESFINSELESLKT